MEAATLLIGDLSQRTGCHIETIRYYERVELLPRAQRRGRYRAYSALPAPFDKRAALALVDVRLIEHVIVTGTGILSFAERGLISYVEWCVRHQVLLRIAAGELPIYFRTPRVPYCSAAIRGEQRMRRGRCRR